MKTVILSAGHSITESGAVFEGLKEADLNMKIVKSATDLLRGQGIGVLNVPDNLDLIQTISWINYNAPNADVAVEVHVNAGGGTGVEGWYYAKSSVSKKLSDTILNSIVEVTGMYNRGSKDELTNRWGRLGFVHDTKPLACLVECGFIDSEQDRVWLNNDNGLYNIGLGIAKGIAKYLGVAWKDNEPEIDPKVEAITNVKSLLADNQSDCQKLRQAVRTLVDILKL